MKKLLILLSIFIFLIAALPAESANLYWRNCLTGGGDCLDGIDGASLADGDGAFVIRDNSGTYEGYIYRLEETAVAESSPDVISPDANAGDKRWRLVNIHAIGFTGTKVNSAGGSADALTLSGTLGIMDGADDIFRGIYLNYTNSNHTAGNVFAINIAGITGDADATESAIYIQEGWDSGILSYSPVHLKGPSDVGKLFLFDTGEADYIAIVPPADVTTAYTLTLPTAAPTEDNSVMVFADDGSSGWANLDDYAAAGDLASYMPLSTFTAAGDVPVGSASGAVTVITKGANNTFFGVNNAGTLGFHSSFNPVYVAAPGTDDTYSGTVATFTAGEALAQWDVVYCKNKSGVHACYKYDANGADKALPPRAMAVAAIDADASGTFLLNGIVRNDGWSQTTNQDEGKIVYADGATAGRMTLTKSTTSADMVAILGYVIEQNVIYFNPSPILVEVP